MRRFSQNCHCLLLSSSRRVGCEKDPQRGEIVCPITPSLTSSSRRVPEDPDVTMDDHHLDLEQNDSVINGLKGLHGAASSKALSPKDRRTDQASRRFHVSGQQRCRHKDVAILVRAPSRLCCRQHRHSVLLYPGPYRQDTTRPSAAGKARASTRAKCGHTKRDPMTTMDPTRRRKICRLDDPLLKAACSTPATSQSRWGSWATVDI